MAKDNKIEYKIPIDTTPIVRKKPVKRTEKRYFVYDFRKKFMGEFNEQGVSDFICMEITSIDGHVRAKTIVKGIYRIYSEKQHVESDHK